MTVQTPDARIPTLTSVSVRDRCSRAAAYGGVPANSQPDCRKPIWVGMFFDGTNNNKKRDKEDIANPAKRSHSNVVVLHDAFRADADSGYFRYYIPGVGTTFPQIGEEAESSSGKSMAQGGEPRLHWAMIQLYNAVHWAAHKRNLVDTDESRKSINRPDALKNAWTLDSGKRRSFFMGLESRLKRAIANRKSEIVQINLSVFGFSRGAAEARTYCNWILECCTKQIDSYVFCGIPIRLQFVGLFDTVASVGLADSSPVGGAGLMDWADGTMAIPSAVERCVHYVAAHEIRKSFPLSSVRQGRIYPANCTEIVYPGAHSDIGGGYAPGEQGKSIGARNRLASQVPLLNMYHEARKSGVPLWDIAKLTAIEQRDVADDLDISPDLAQRFRDYAIWSRVSSVSVEDLLFQHMRLYWRWRLKTAPHFEELASVQQANPQDREDLRASERDFQRDMQQVIQRKRQIELVRQRRGTTPPPLSPLYAAAAEEARAIDKVPQAVHEFFDGFIHDSHASFYLAGPVTAHDKSEKLKLVKEKQRRGNTLTPFEQRMLEVDATQPGEFPVMTDGDFEDLLDLESASTEAVVKVMTTTRRESDGHLRVRVVFDRS
ncbi:T6SS phospholipase effector Tle1-like catalytic domain-containing protein [Aromatoleum toluclasticum]|uniref:T6SS phospholipase effector Tle1-like catalytic domain-containing protein n=1 Tax=Aromatoleum toluclasticum TaxID=92003 RepID=UPI0003AAFDB7|nr:DUF2235 domain-containing protein [Aromatoleum toluclasticum]